MAHERKCIVCGKEYTYCPKCGGKDNPNEVWRTIFCSSNCMSVNKIWDKYRASTLTLDDAKKMLSQYEVLSLEQYSSYMQPAMKDLLTSSEATIENEIVSETISPAIDTIENIESVQDIVINDSDISKKKRRNRKSVSRTEIVNDDLDLE